jgi:23S rRNA-/tRNA-specific pseudouridylate synthase
MQLVPLHHEPPALDHPVTVVAETPDIVAVHKPATVPVHPTVRRCKLNSAMLPHGLKASDFKSLT